MDGGMSTAEQLVIEERRNALDDRIGVLAAQIHSLEAELVGTLAEFDELNGWQGNGWRSFAHFVSMRTKFAPRDAERLVTVAGRVDELPTLLADARAGQLSLGVLASAARVVTPENETQVAEVVRACTPTQAQRVLAAYRDVRPTGHDSEEEVSDPADDPVLDHWWRSWTDNHGRHRIDAALDKLTGELLEQARQAATAELERESGLKQRPTPLESITAMASTVLEHASTAGVRDRGGERFAVQVVCDIETLAAILGIQADSNLPIRLGARAYLPRTGTHLTDTELSRAICEGTLQILIEHAGQPLWLGTEQRLFNRHQRRALRHRAGGQAACEFPGCPTTRYVETHHIEGVAETNGPSDVKRPGFRRGSVG